MISDKTFDGEVEAMLENDLKNCRRIDSREYTSRGFDFRYAVRFARLLAPIL